MLVGELCERKRYRSRLRPGIRRKASIHRSSTLSDADRLGSRGKGVEWVDEMEVDFGGRGDGGARGSKWGLEP